MKIGDHVLAQLKRMDEMTMDLTRERDEARRIARLALELVLSGSHEPSVIRTAGELLQQLEEPVKP